MRTDWLLIEAQCERDTRTAEDIRAELDCAFRAKYGFKPMAEIMRVDGWRCA